MKSHRTSFRRSVSGVRQRLGIAATALLAMVSAVAHAEQVEVAPWFVDVERDKGIAVLFDSDQIWVLMVRCLNRETDLVVRRRDEPEKIQPAIRHFTATLRIDGVATHLAAQTFSVGGFLMLDAGASVDQIERGRQISFDFDNGEEQTLVKFQASRTREALAPVRRICAAATS